MRLRGALLEPLKELRVLVHPIDEVQDPIVNLDTRFPTQQSFSFLNIANKNTLITWTPIGIAEGNLNAPRCMDIVEQLQQGERIAGAASNVESLSCNFMMTIDRKPISMDKIADIEHIADLFSIPVYRNFFS